MQFCRYFTQVTDYISCTFFLAPQIRLLLTIVCVRLYVQGEVTSRSLRSRYDRHFVGISWHNALSYTAKIYRVI